MAECEACGETAGLRLCDFCERPACMRHRGRCPDHGLECLLCAAYLHEPAVPLPRKASR